MGNSSARQYREIKQPKKIIEFRSPDLEVTSPVVPLPSSKRELTDLPFAIIFASLLIILAPFLAWILIYEGTTNFVYDHQDNADYQQIVNDLQKSAWYIVGMCAFGIALSIILLLLFRFFTAAVVWTTYVGSILGLVSVTCYIWVTYSKLEDDDPVKERALGGAVMLTILSTILIIVTIFTFKKIQLVIKLFNQAIKVVFEIPLLFLEPLLTFLALLALYIISGYFMIIIILSHTDYQEEGRDGVARLLIFLLTYLIIITIWMHQFILGCQHMVLAGAVAAVYFQRKVSPIYKSFYNLVRYHLGTVAFGSFILTVAALVRALLKVLFSNKYLRVCVDVCCLQPIETLLRYISGNAYIETALHGQPFWQSGKRAIQLLTANALTTVAINTVSTYVLFMAKLLIIVSTAFVGIAMNSGINDIPNFYIGILISVKVVSLVAYCTFTVFQTAIDTIFLCYCEEMTENTDISEPQYYMSDEMMKCMEDIKATSKKK